ncbi:MAG: histidine ammonia-lyase [Candidatus Eremiobacteraeota bacterium]|nr:histidine ammonia-lyase [Candidatus Eremiobacteraeota bacterium]
MDIIRIDGDNLTPEMVHKVARNYIYVEIDESAIKKIEESRDFIEKILTEKKTHYGINTGFGAFESIRIPPEDLQKLQVNLIRSHSAGVGEPLPTDVVRAMMLLRANALCRGHSGVRLEIVRLLVDMLNKCVHPVVPSRGSVGASGDLAPLAHIALSMIGEGKSEYRGEILPGGEALQRAGLKPAILCEKEGLALINGTQMMAGIGTLILRDMEKLILVADAAGALSTEVLMGTDRAFIPEIQEVRPHMGQIESAGNLLKFTEGSEMIKSHGNCPRIQDAYSIRCIPAVHGASRESCKFARRILCVEINSSVDNPLVFPDIQQIVSGGNFHGAPVALVLESMALGLAFIANISERRIERMVNHHYSNGLPPFLSPEAGLQSGMMIAHYTAAALASENKVLCHPACCDTIPTSAGQEDCVSMGSISALKLMNIFNNTVNIVAIELLCASEAVEHRSPHQPGRITGIIYQKIRNEIQPLSCDRPLSEDIEKVAELIKHEGFIGEIEETMKA